MNNEISDAEVIRLLASGAVLRIDRDNSGAELITRHGDISSTQWNRLVNEGWLKGFPSNAGAWLSDEGRAAYLRSTDEMGNGELIPPCQSSEEGREVDGTNIKTCA